MRVIFVDGSHIDVKAEESVDAGEYIRLISKEDKEAERAVKARALLVKSEVRALVDPNTVME